MRVVCLANTAKSLDLTEVTLVRSTETDFPVKKEKEYIVMGIIICKDSNCLYYLVDDYDLPDWVPYPLFKIIDNNIFPDWYVKIFDKVTSEGNLFYLSGFKELCNDEYFIALVEREQWALDIYYKRKREAQEWYELKPFMNR